MQRILSNYLQRGFSACFNSALELIKNQKNISGASTISAQVSLYAENEMSFVLGVEIEGHVEGISLEETQELLEANFIRFAHILKQLQVILK